MQAETDCFLPQADQRYLNENGIAVDYVTDGNQKGVVLLGFHLPENHFQVSAADVLIILPNGYPELPPDMFFVDPWLTVGNTGRYAQAADQPKQFAGRRWQQWSRHNNSWRPGIDFIRTHVRRITKALEEAR